MPELAEVETVRRTLKKLILNKKIKDVNVVYSNIIESNIDEFKSILLNKEFIDIDRIGKWLMFDLKDYYLLSHLRMEGKYFVKDKSSPIDKHEHIIITFADGLDLRYHDTRKFGRMNLVKKSDIEKIDAIKRLGIEANSNELNKEYIYQKIHNKNIPIKSLLLDQSIISGLGNIYACEVLFASRINPCTLGMNLSMSECVLIVDASKCIINEAIKAGGTTIKSYTSSLGVTGKFQQHLMVYKRDNMPCKVCGTKIQNIKIGGRSTYFCPTCQKKRKNSE